MPFDLDDCEFVRLPIGPVSGTLAANLDDIADALTYLLEQIKELEQEQPVSTNTVTYAGEAVTYGGENVTF